MKARVSESGVMFWERGKLVWDDYRGHQQIALTSKSEAVLRWFAQWREVDSVAMLGEVSLAIAERLLEEGILVAEGSTAHRAEEHLQRHWGRWGVGARYYHFSARSTAASRFLSVEEDAERMLRKAAVATPPPASADDPGRRLVALNRHDLHDDELNDSAWPRRRLIESLRHRRSVREFEDGPSLGQLATLLWLAGGTMHTVASPGGAPAVFKTSPSAGARAPVEHYVVTTGIDGMAGGVYHFAPGRGGLEELAAQPSTEDIREAVGGQAWLATAPVWIVHTAVLARVSWRYETPRAYRDILVGLGHVSQTLLLAATAMGLGATFVSAVREEKLEQLLGRDPVTEPVVGVTGIGVPAQHPTAEGQG
jgi:SagB-type dehydrogenase family enzyme